MPCDQSAAMIRDFALLGKPSSCRRFVEKVKVPIRVRCTGLRRAAHCTSTPKSRTVGVKEDSGLARSVSLIDALLCH
eukprot:6477282-Amphidinium_carterae.1